METFVVRIRPGNAREPGLRGVVDEVATGARCAFTTADELLGILATGVPGPGEAAGEPNHGVDG